MENIQIFTDDEVKSLLSGLTTIDDIPKKIDQKCFDLRREAIAAVVPELIEDMKSERAQRDLEHYNQLPFLFKCTTSFSNTMLKGFSMVMPDSVTNPLIGSAIGIACGAAAAHLITDEDNPMYYFSLAHLGLSIGFLSLNLTSMRNLDNRLF